MSTKTAAKQPKAKEMSKLQWTWKEMKRNKVAYLMILPYMLVFTCFTVLYVFEQAYVSAVLHNLQHTADEFGGGLDDAFALSVEGGVLNDAHGVVQWIALHLTHLTNTS